MKKIYSTILSVMVLGVGYSQTGNVRVTSFGNTSAGDPNLSVSQGRVVVVSSSNAPFMVFPTEGPTAAVNWNDVKKVDNKYGPNHIEVQTDGSNDVVAYVDYDSKKPAYYLYLTSTSDSGQTWTTPMIYDTIKAGSSVTTTNPNPVMEYADGQIFLGGINWHQPDSGMVKAYRVSPYGYYPFGEIPSNDTALSKYASRWAYGANKVGSKSFHAFAFSEDYQAEVYVSVDTSDGYAMGTPQSVWKMDQTKFNFGNIQDMDVTVGSDGFIGVVFTTFLEDAQFNMEEKIMLVTSSDYGKTWQTDSVRNAGASASSPQLFFRSTGEAIVTYKRNSHLYMGSSIDGEHWTHRQVSDTNTVNAYDAELYDDVLSVVWNDSRFGWAMDEIYYDTLQTKIDANNRPTAVNDTATVVKDVTTKIDVLKNDSGNGKLTLVNLGVNGSGNATTQGGMCFIDVATAQVEYYPPTGFAGVDSFLYVINDENQMADTAMVMVTVENPVHAEEVDKILVSVFPQPATEVLNVVLDRAVVGQLNLVDQHGKVLISQILCNEGVLQLEVAHLSTGIYFLQILDQEAGLQESFKVMISR